MGESLDRPIEIKIAIKNAHRFDAFGGALRCRLDTVASMVVVVLIAVSEKSTPLVALLIEERGRESGKIHGCVSFEVLSETPASLLDPSNLSEHKKKRWIIGINRGIASKCKKILDLTSLENATTSYWLQQRLLIFL